MSMSYRVLQVGSSLRDWGGIERFVLYLATSLQARGLDVTVACPAESPLSLRLIGVEKVPINTPSQFSVSTFLEYRKLFKSRRFDVVHAHFSPDYVMPLLAARSTRQPLIVMSRHVAVPWANGKAKMYSRLCDHFVPVSDAVRKRMADSGVDPQRMTVAKAGVPTPEFLGDVPPSRPLGALRVGSFSRLVKEKGIEVLVEAAFRTDNVDVVIYGDGPEKANLKTLAGGRVEMAGKVADVSLAMASCDLIAVPSIWEEAFPYSVLESFAVGRPVVASRIGGLPEIVKPGWSGYLFESGNPKDLGEVLSRARDNRTELQRLGINAREVHRSEYTVEKMGERFDLLYRKLRKA